MDKEMFAFACAIFSVFAVLSLWVLVAVGEATEAAILKVASELRDVREQLEKSKKRGGK